MIHPGNLGNPTKEVKDLYNESFQTWKKENKEDTRRWACPMLMFTSVKLLSSHADEHEESLIWLTLWCSLLLDHGIHLILNIPLPFDVCQLKSPLYPTLPWMCMNATQSSKANAQSSQLCSHMTKWPRNRSPFKKCTGILLRSCSQDVKTLSSTATRDCSGLLSPPSPTHSSRR